MERRVTLAPDSPHLEPRPPQTPGRRVTVSFICRISFSDTKSGKLAKSPLGDYRTSNTSFESELRIIEICSILKLTHASSTLPSLSMSIAASSSATNPPSSNRYHPQIRRRVLTHALKTYTWLSHRWRATTSLNRTFIS